MQLEAKNNLFLINAVAPVAAEIFSNIKKAASHSLSLKELNGVIINWLKNETYKHPLIIPTDQLPEKTMQEFVDMATGIAPISLDYCIGQVWRHCQSTIYEELSYSECSDEVIAELVGIDERMKRYAYGPPVESLQQLLALIKAKVMTLKIVDDPAIGMTEDGRRFHENGQAITANIMINTVLVSPHLLSVNSPIIRNLLMDELIKPIHSDLGVLTDNDGFVISNNSNKKTQLLS